MQSVRVHMRDEGDEDLTAQDMVATGTLGAAGRAIWPPRVNPARPIRYAGKTSYHGIACASTG
jgi:hypothetical protein